MIALNPVPQYPYSVDEIPQDLVDDSLSLQQERISLINRGEYTVGSNSLEKWRKCCSDSCVVALVKKVVLSHSLWWQPRSPAFFFVA